MIKEIRKIKLDEIIKENEPKLERLNLELKELEELPSTINVDELDKEIEELQKQRNKFFVKIFNKKKYNELIRTYIIKTKLRYRIRNVDHNIHEKKLEINLINDRIERAREYFRKQNLIDMGLDFNQAISLLNEHGLEPILTEEDKDIIEIASKRRLEETSSVNTGKINMDVMKQYALVHKTNYCPNGGRINTDKEVGIQEKVTFSLDKIGSLQFSTQRNTIHFAVNGEVGDHNFGDWHDCKYAVIIPFTEMPISQLKCGACMDTYIENGLNLPSSAILLCPKEEIEQARKNNPNVKVVGYSGQNVSGYADSMVGILGYKVESVRMWSWANERDANKYYEDLKESNLDIPTTPHSFSYEKEQEVLMTGVKVFESLVDKMIENRTTLSDEEIKSIIKRYSFSLAGLFSYQNVKFQSEVFKEIIPFLEGRGVTISEKSINEVMSFVSAIDSYQIAFDTKDSSYHDIEHTIYELKKSHGCNTEGEYINSILFKEIFEQLNKRIMENQMQGKAR